MFAASPNVTRRSMMPRGITYLPGTISVIRPPSGINLSVPIFSLSKVSQYIKLESLPPSMKILVVRIVSRNALTTKGNLPTSTECSSWSLTSKVIGCSDQGNRVVVTVLRCKPPEQQVYVSNLTGS